MNWYKLKENKCPNCGKAITQTPLDRFIRCVNCDFSISQEKMSEIVSKMVKKNLDTEKFADNFSELNNL